MNSSIVKWGALLVHHRAVMVEPFAFLAICHPLVPRRRGTSLVDGAAHKAQHPKKDRIQTIFIITLIIILIIMSMMTLI
jgi:hypothetical protein